MVSANVVLGGGGSVSLSHGVVSDAGVDGNLGNPVLATPLRCGCFRVFILHQLTWFSILYM